MSWSPRWRHVSQLHPPGLSGWNDCWEACLARYLRERDPAVSEGDDWALIDAVSQAARGTPDSPSNGDTTLSQADASLSHFGLPVEWTTDFQAALAAPWSICLVDGSRLAPEQYPASWFTDPGQANHFVLWLPNWRGAANWFNDPLAFADGQEDCTYDLASVAAAFSGAYLLPSTGHGETPPATWTNTRGVAFGLLSQPRHGSTCLAVVPVGGTGLVEGATANDDAGTVWQRGQWRDRHGWFPREYVTIGGG